MGEQRATQALVDAPSGTIGRSPDASLVIDEPTNHVSRIHLLVQLDGPVWTVRDWRSAHGTVISRSGRRVDLARGAIDVLEPGMRLLLAAKVQLRVDEAVVIRSGAGTVMQSESRHVVAPVLDGDLYDFAYALCAPYRDWPPRHGPASIEDVAVNLHIARRTAYNRLNALAQLAPVASRLGNSTGAARTREIAAALVALYPTLTQR